MTSKLDDQAFNQEAREDANEEEALVKRYASYGLDLRPIDRAELVKRVEEHQATGKEMTAEVANDILRVCTNTEMTAEASNDILTVLTDRDR